MRVRVGDEGMERMGVGNLVKVRVRERERGELSMVMMTGGGDCDDRGADADMGGWRRGLGRRGRG